MLPTTRMVIPHLMRELQSISSLCISSRSKPEMIFLSVKLCVLRGDYSVDK